MGKLSRGGIVMVVVWIVASVIFVVLVTARYASLLERPCVRPFPEPSRRPHVEARRAWIARQAFLLVLRPFGQQRSQLGNIRWPTLRASSFVSRLAAVRLPAGVFFEIGRNHNADGSLLELRVMREFR